jgi:hypothetical protein
VCWGNPWDLTSIHLYICIYIFGLGQNHGLGKLYTLVALDGNGNIHVAVGHGGNESGPEWIFFLQFFMLFLLTANCYLISDQMGGIFNAIFAVANIMNANVNNEFYLVCNLYKVAVWWPANLFKMVDGKLQRWTGCLTHRYGNVKTKFGIEFAKLFAVCAKAIQMTSCKLLKIK